MDQMLRDFRFAGRTLTRTPGYAAVVVLSLGLSVGAVATIFSIVDGVLLEPLPYQDPERIVRIEEVAHTGIGRELEGLASQRLFLRWRESDPPFRQMAMYSNQAATLEGLDRPVRVTGVAASPALFPLLGVEALHGRTFVPDEETPGGDDVLLLSHRAWQRYFGGVEEAVGRRVDLDGRSRTVIGVMPEGFSFPEPSIEYWVPLTDRPFTGTEEFGAAGQVEEEVEEGPRRGGAPGGGGARREVEMWGRLVARLDDGVSAEVAAERGTSLVRGLRDSESPDSDRRVEVASLHGRMVRGVRTPLWTLMGAVGFVLLIACANVANLAAARSSRRRQEIAVRAALGASRTRLLRLLSTESVLLALVGGVMGLGLAELGVQVLDAAAPEFLPRLDAVQVDARVVGFTLIAALLAGLVSGLLPARGATGPELTEALKEASGTGAFTRSPRGSALRDVLVIAQVSLSVVLLTGAGLLMASFLRLTGVDPGYDPDNVLHLQAAPSDAGAGDPAEQLARYERALDALEGVEGVVGATVASRAPSETSNIQIALRVDGERPARRDEPDTPVGVRIVEPSYFEVLGIRPTRGRTFDDGDGADARPVAILSRSGAEAIFGEPEVVGRELPFADRRYEIVGVVEDVHTAGTDPRPQADLYLPIRQAPSRMIPMLFRPAQLLVRTGPGPLSLVPAIRARMGSVAPGLMVTTVSTLGDRLAESVAEPRFYTGAVGAFALLAVVLAAVGIYGVLAYSVQQRLRETAIRRALGARVGQILRLVVGRAMLLTGAGLALGLGASLAVTRVLEAMLYQVEPGDPLVLAAVVVAFACVSLAAAWLPARRALAVDPAEVLREG